MTDRDLTDLIACGVLAWTVGPDRYVMSARRWAPRWRFQPLVRIEDAFKALSSVGNSYLIERHATGEVSVTVFTDSGSGASTSRSVPRAISIATARAVGIDIPSELEADGDTGPFVRKANGL